MKHYDYFWVHFSSCLCRLKSSTGSRLATHCIRFLKFPSKIRNSPVTYLDPSLSLDQNSRGLRGCKSGLTEAGVGSKQLARESVLVRARLTCYLAGLTGWVRKDTQSSCPRTGRRSCALLTNTPSPLVKSIHLRKTRHWRPLCLHEDFSALPRVSLRDKRQ